jgi:hypothetical protein
MPTSAEFGAVGNYVIVGTWSASTGNAEGTDAINSGWRRTDLNTPYFPATGNRNFSTGALYYVGTVGFYWSSSPVSDVDGFGMYCSVNMVGSASSYSRMHGFAVRCVVQ